MPKLCYLDSIVSVVDAKRMSDEFSSGDDLLNEETQGDDITKLVIEQIEFCNTIILNKVDEVTPEQLAQVKKVIKALQPTAKIIETNYNDKDEFSVVSNKIGNHYYRNVQRIRKNRD